MLRRAVPTRLLTTTSIPLALSPEKRAQELARMNTLVEPLLQRNPLEVLAWANKEFDGKLAMSTSMGLQAPVLLHLATLVKPDIPVIWVDTGYLPRETYLYAEELKQVLGLNLIVVNNSQWSAARIEAVHGEKLWERDHNLYGKLTKVEPLANALGGLLPSPLCMLSGLRAGQTKARANMTPVSQGRDGRFKVLPMLRMTDADVADYMFKHDLPKHPLQSKGYVTVGDWHSSRPLAEGEDPRATRFGGKFEECGLHVDDGAPVSTTTPTTTPTAAAAAGTEGEPVLLPPGLESLGFVKAHEDTDMAVIMVKKTMLDGTPCRKCQDVANKLVQDATLKWIGHFALADVANSKSEGGMLAQRFEVVTAPFFLVRTKEEQDRNENWKPVRSYLLLKKMLQEAAEKKQAALGEGARVDSSNNSTSVIVEDDPKLVEHRRHLLEVNAQISQLQSRAKEIEHQMTVVAAKLPE
ncbi:hypothetical protein BASA81_006654 [Batrachochytrium salamandrivorans]|nr:hypothetical protein BASA81_006654 [Batrachochytrium salamandrivorans]